jgi:hypothetical protein
MRQESMVEPTNATNLPYIPSGINEIDAINGHKRWRSTINPGSANKVKAVTQRRQKDKR